MFIVQIYLLLVAACTDIDVLIMFFLPLPLFSLLGNFFHVGSPTLARFCIVSGFYASVSLNHQWEEEGEGVCVCLCVCFVLFWFFFFLPHFSSFHHW